MESEVADALVPGEGAVYADRAYEKRSLHAAFKALGIKDRIQHRRTRGQAALPRSTAVRKR